MIAQQVVTVVQLDIRRTTHGGSCARGGQNSDRDVRNIERQCYARATLFIATYSNNEGISKLYSPKGINELID